ncbi:hypothetical protein AL036_18755 [Salipiger aestuarii]|nr:hypothetical protein AL036_18755 [Salipiger aestuarii]
MASSVVLPLVEFDTLHRARNVQPHADRSELPVCCLAALPGQGDIEGIELPDRLPHRLTGRADDFRFALSDLLARFRHAD